MASPQPHRRAFLLTAAAALAIPRAGFAQSAAQPFAQWVATLRPLALRRGVSEATFTRVMGAVKPDLSVFSHFRSQPEFREALWQYLNRRVSDWRIATGQERAREFASLFERIERDFGVARGVLLGLWGVETAFGDPVVHANHARPVIPSLAALAWGEPRRRDYWQRELLNALLIVERGWSNPNEMRGSWAGAMGHTQWMPEVWLNIGFDYDGDGRVSPFGRPDDALASSARYLVQRGRYRRGEHWGYEVRTPAGLATSDSKRTFADWQKLGVARADGKDFPQPAASAQLWIPVSGGPAFLLGPNFFAVKTYNPSMNYTLGLLHLGDRVLGAGAFVQAFPGSERAPTLAEVQEIQRRLTALGFDTAGTDGRVGLQTMSAVRDFQRKAGLQPTDGYAGVKLLARLRQGL
ncbi:MAG: lytic murein transglycosylase [Pseudorhodoplanes sp.]|nr:lytic murein transglycosylase [Pseudorhodoplanes sp.]MCQ3942085.1 lytic murein transglycosylase [Alphaproteobacteria bacterium]